MKFELDLSARQLEAVYAELIDLLDAEFAKFNLYTVPILLDSGAFSVARSGATVDLHEYAEFLSRWFEARPGSAQDHAISLDVIAVARGKRFTATEFEECASQGYQNYQYLTRDRGLPVWPVYHYADDLTWLKRYLDSGAERIAIAGSAGFGFRYKKNGFFDQWLSDLFSWLDREGWLKRVKLHALGSAGNYAVIDYPWYSLDSTGLFVNSAHGEATIDDRIVVFSTRSDKEKHRKNFFCLAKSEQDYIRARLAEIGIGIEDMYNPYGRAFTTSFFAYKRLQATAARHRRALPYIYTVSPRYPLHPSLVVAQNFRLLFSFADEHYFPRKRLDQVFCGNAAMVRKAVLDVALRRMGPKTALRLLKKHRGRELKAVMTKNNHFLL